MQEQTSSNSLGERVPKLRFPEFEGEWVCEKLSDFTERVTRKNTNNETELPLTISSKDGLVDQISYFNKTVASKDMSGYYLLKHGEYAYNKSYSVGYSFGSIKRLDRYAMGALSTLYICFTLKKHNTDFVNTYFDSLKWYHEIHMISAEGARNHGLLNVPTEIFFETKHWLPINLDEQEKIAKFFQLLEYRIEIQQKLLDALKLYKRGLLSKLFPQKGERVPQYRFEGFTDAWEQRKLGEIVDVYSGRDYKHLGEGTIPVYGTGGYMLSVSEALSEKDDAIGIGRKGTIDNPHILRAPFWTVDTLFYCIPKKDLDLDFVFNIFQKINWKAMDESTGVPSLSKTAINNVAVMIPAKNEQAKLGGYFANLAHLITLHQQMCSEMKSIKKCILQNMFV